VADDGECWGDGGALTSGYEQLRAAVLSSGAGGWRLGHAVLSAHGMTGWMSSFSAIASPAATAGMGGAADCAPASTAASSDPPHDRPGSLADTDQVVAVLAQMTLALAA